MDPTLLKKHTPKSTTASNSTNKKPHPTPTDPIPVAPHHNSSIQNISNHFAKLYSNHKLLIASLKGSQQPNTTTHFSQEKGINNNSLKGLDLDSSCIALTKSNSHHGRRRTIHVPEEASADLALGKEESNCTKTKVKEKDKNKYSVVNHTPTIKKKSLQAFNNEVKKSLSGKVQKEERKNKEFFEGGGGKDVKKESALMSKSLDLDKFNEVGLCVMKRPSFSLAVNGGGGGRRKSFCCSETELADFFSCSGVKVVAVDMPPFMQIHAVDCARKAHDSLEKFTSKTLAFTLKKEFDGVYGPAWHCIVGTSFGSFVTHSVGGFMYFSMDHKLYILLFKTTVQRAD